MNTLKIWCFASVLAITSLSGAAIAGENYAKKGLEFIGQQNIESLGKPLALDCYGADKDHADCVKKK
jgi:hypothetical protein